MADFADLLIPSSFLRPAFANVLSAWTEHIPFAFWIVEAHRPDVFVELGTHWGTSYFAFCQAVAHLGLDTRTFAVDSWQGDPHAGHYGEEVFAAVAAINLRHFAAFSSLRRTSFDQAVDTFPDRSIDLLHIDGFHTYEAVSRDFANWQPKLSERAVVLFHDTNARHADFGVYRLWAELTPRFPHFEFLHGSGLGVLGCGSSFSPMLDRLFSTAGQEDATRRIRLFFEHLGKAVSEREQLKAEMEAAVRERETERTALKTTIDGLSAGLHRQKEDFDQLMVELQKTKSHRWPARWIAKRKLARWRPREE